MKNILILVLALILASCSSFCPKPAEPELVTKIERVIVTPPNELFESPSYDIPIDTNKATQKIIADFILKTEARLQVFEEKLKALKQFYKESK